MHLMKSSDFGLVQRNLVSCRAKLGHLYTLFRGRMVKDSLFRAGLTYSLGMTKDDCGGASFLSCRGNLSFMSSVSFIGVEWRTMRRRLAFLAEIISISALILVTRCANFGDVFFGGQVNF